MIAYSDADQGSDQWLLERSSLLTASNFKIAMSTGATRQNLLDSLAFQRRTGTVISSYTSSAMQRGHDIEPEARAWAAFELGQDIAEVGLAVNSDYPGIGASLDGLLPCGKVGAEFKAPLGHTHNRYLRQNKLPADYKWQVYGQQLVCDLDGVWFCSYHPDDTKQLLIYVPRNEDIIAELKTGLDKFLSDLHKMEGKI